MKRKCFYKIFVIIIIYVMIFPYSIVLAATPEEVGLYVASYAKNFCEKYTIVYGSSGDGFGTLYGNTFTSECVSFTRRMYKDSTGYGNDGAWVPVPSGNAHPGTGIAVFNSPKDTQNGKRNDDFELIGVNDLSLAIPGDIIENYHHDMIYIGDVDGVDDVIANNGHNTNSSGLANGLFAMEEYVHSGTAFCGHAEMKSGEGGCNFRIWRITEEAAERLGDASSFDAGGALVSGKGSRKKAGKYTINMADFYYNGIPDGKYSVTKGVMERVVEALADVLEFLVTLFANILRMIFVGWTAIAENLVTVTVKSVSGEDNIEVISSTDVGVDSGDNITVEKIVFNQISIFDVNFFNYNEEIEKQSDLDKNNQSNIEDEE